MPSHLCRRDAGQTQDNENSTCGDHKAWIPLSLTIHSVQEDQEADDQEIPDYRPSPRKAEPQIADQIQPDVKNKLLLIIEQYQLGHKLGQTSLI